MRWCRRRCTARFCAPAGTTCTAAPPHGTPAAIRPCGPSILGHAGDEQAAAAYVEAARFHIAGYRFERARSLIERGLTLDCGRADRFALACLHGDVLDALGSIRPAIAAFEAARDLAETDAEQYRAWFGLAAGMRMVDDLTGAMEALEHAEAAAMRAGLVAERFHIHHLRGNLCFPRGDLDGCLREHEAALEWARRGECARP